MSELMEHVLNADKISSGLVALENGVKALRKLYDTDHQERLTKTLEGINPKLVALKKDLEDLSDLVPAPELVQSLDEKTARHIVKELAKLMERYSIGECT